ncbi:MAG: hypothetical protein MUP66_00750 [Candidatus Nanohaloarchaeota archaeon QJJ-5]|nr:hypothetical protein [Candidatus Nanohaloarchaeota archaeon QJJ-5]
MLVFCSGIAACGEKEYLKAFEQLCDERGKEVRIHALGERIREIGRQDYPDLGKYDLLKYPDSTVNAWRAAALEAIINEIEQTDDDVVHILDAHASFWKKNGPEPAINTSYIKRLEPDFFVQIIDYEPDIYDRLKEKDDLPEEYELSVEEVVRWQETERYTNKILADHHQRPFFVLARQHPPESLYNMIFTDKPKVYQSFPITNLDDESLAGIKDYIEDLRPHATVFDPIEIDPQEFDDDKVMELLHNHTVKRDEQFIDQSDIVIVNFPKMVYSSGVEYEINYASRSGKPVWIIKPEGYAGPFTEYNCDREFAKPEECIEALQEKFGESDDA